MDLLLISRDALSSSLISTTFTAIEAKKAGIDVGVVFTQEALAAICEGTFVWPKGLTGQELRWKMADNAKAMGMPTMGGKGDGPLIEFLKQTPPDLTLLSKRYGGVYPQDKVYDWIRDVGKVWAHGTQEMPVWGERYSREIIETYGPDYAGPGSSVTQRILELVYYIGSIQQ